jgi:mycothiol S-conjugate amidase
MPGSEANAHPDAFANVPLEVPVAQLAEIIRRERPQVVVTYADDQQGYPHPDHLRVHDITGPAIERAADPAWRPEVGEPWQVQKLYYSVWSKQRTMLMHEAFLELGLESPYTQEWFDRPWQDERITTSVPIGAHRSVRWDALLAHATQVDPASPFWFGLPRDRAEAIHPFDDYILAWSRVATDLPEDDLFAGLA